MTVVQTALIKVGQNTYISGSSNDGIGTSNCNVAVTGWYNEVDDMVIEYAASFTSNTPKVIDHYTATIWATTQTVGYGVAYCQSIAIWPTHPYNRVNVCKYGPLGTLIGSLIYSQGPPDLPVPLEL